jgi:Fe-S oxidoreductase
LKFNGTLIDKSIYHDSCCLGRWNGIMDVPRDLLLSINSGRKLVELERNRTEGFCCGAGGARMFMEGAIGKRINNGRDQEIITTGATQVAAA